jgi:hypothetical protein
LIKSLSTSTLRGQLTAKMLPLSYSPERELWNQANDVSVPDLASRHTKSLGQGRRCVAVWLIAIHSTSRMLEEAATLLKVDEKKSTDACNPFHRRYLHPQSEKGGHTSGGLAS